VRPTGKPEKFFILVEETRPVFLEHRIEATAQKKAKGVRKVVERYAGDVEVQL
jgi:hypothetical protein